MADLRHGPDLMSGALQALVARAALVSSTILALGAGSVVLPPGTYTFEVWGGGAGAAASGYTLWTNGAGAYSRVTLTFAVATTVYYFVGAGNSPGDNMPGFDSWLNIASNTAPTLATQGALAKGGNVGDSTTPGTGGQASAGVGTTKNSGGNGVRVDFLLGPNDGSNYTGPGGAGAGGPTGNGANGGASGTGGAGNSPGGNGGNGEVTNGATTITPATNPTAPGGGGPCGVFGFGTLGAPGQVVITQTA